MRIPEGVRGERPETRKEPQQASETPSEKVRRSQKPGSDRPPQARAGRFEKNPPAIKVLIADSQPLFADSLTLALQAYHRDLNVLEQRPIAAADLLAAISEGRPDVTLLDYWMEMDGAAATRMILSQNPGHRVIILSWFHGPREIEHCFDAGAVGFLPKSLMVDQVAEGIRLAHAGERPIYADQLEHVMRKIETRDAQADLAWQKLVDLTAREILVLRMLSLGKGVADIGEELFVSQSTVRKHIFNTLQKLDTHSQLEAIALARKYGLLQS